MRAPKDAHACLSRFLRPASTRTGRRSRVRTWPLGRAAAGQSVSRTAVLRVRTYIYAQIMLASRAASARLVSALTLACVLTAVSGVAAGATTVTAADEVASTTAATAAEGRGHFKKTMMNPYMLIPQLISLGFAPIVLANLKMMVMSALMINNMALNAAIFMTIRNLVFGPRPTVKYTNYGYRDSPSDHEHEHHAQYHREHAGQDGRRPLLDETATWDRRRRKKRTDVVS